MENQPQSRSRVDLLKVVITALSLSWTYYLFDAGCTYYSLEDKFFTLNKSLSQKNNILMDLTKGESYFSYMQNRKAKLAGYLEANKVIYSNAEILSHLSMLSEVTNLADISPKIKEATKEPSLIAVRVHCQVKGKFHNIAKFINLLEQKKYRYPVRVNKLTIKRSNKNPGGDLIGHLELMFYQLPRKIAEEIFQLEKSVPGSDNSDESLLDENPAGEPPGDSSNIESNPGVETIDAE